MIGYFEEKKGVKSSTRRNSWVLLWYFIACDVIYRTGKIIEIYVTEEGHMEDLITWWYCVAVFIFLIGIFAPKYLHKLAELKLGKDGDTK